MAVTYLYSGILLIMIKKLLSWLRKDPVFVLKDAELFDPWKVELRDALNAKDSNKAANLMLLAEEKRQAKQIH